MTTKNFFAIAILVTLSMTSCLQVCPDPPINTDKAVSFIAAVGSSIPATRVTGTSWSIGDAIGVFMLYSGYTLATEHIVEGTPANAKYITDAGGTAGSFAPALPLVNNTITFPRAGMWTL